MSDWIGAPSGPLCGELRVPGDKSISHRAIMLAALAEGVTHIHGFLEGEDTLATAEAFAQMGVRIDVPQSGTRVVHGVGLHGLRGPNAAIDCGNAGTGMRLLSGILAAQTFDSTLIGDASLSRRPMQRVIEPLMKMGAQIRAGEGGLPPLRFGGGRVLHGIDYTVPVASAQVKSAILLAGLYAHGTTRVCEPHPTRDYTERMLADFGWPVEFGDGWGQLQGGHRLHASDIDVPADFSSAAFFLVAATLVPGSELCLRGVGMHPRRTGLLRVLQAMGADIHQSDPRTCGGGAVVDLIVRHAPLHGIDVPVEAVADMIDEFPILFVAAALAQGTTRIRGAAELRVKESDRIAVMARALRALGIRIEESPDGATIKGGRLVGSDADAAGDHRCAMSLAVAAQCAGAEVRIRDCANVATSFPGFVETAVDCGFGLKVGAG
ncbi:MAG: 3-phosphoshikimate 1-carboxyvinyltransferase [Rudaea sp.]